MAEGEFLVVGQRHTTRYNEATQAAEDGLEVSFTYGNPITTGKVFVAGERPDPAAVRAAILDYVQRGNAILGLTG